MANTSHQASHPLTRRRLVHSAAWSMPIVSLAATAPALAASGCHQYVLDYSTWSRTSVSAGSGVATSATGAPITVTVTSTPDTGVTLLDATSGANLRPINTVVDIDPSNTTKRRSLPLFQRAPRNSGQTATVNFTSGGAPIAVRNLTFAIGDIDGTADQHWPHVGQGSYLDAIALTGSFTWSPGRAPMVSGVDVSTGVGSLTTPWSVSKSFQNDIYGTNAAYEVVATYPGPLTSFGLRYTNVLWLDRPGTDQVVVLSRLFFEVCT
ncbi:hypothetical protein [Serinibacter salmoneus]|uniref:Uncharacterized protein n=1 Tax=Serinibacter salmoneus TaxID=556530 RepID=A0A2A9D2V4_9MICO|nr:hypothetical protein [Serinibacter salmoneus]PFG21038.1 hypothetical protein ATL40_2657 [Serinibacter salmoneus]